MSAFRNRHASNGQKKRLLPHFSIIKTVYNQMDFVLYFFWDTRNYYDLEFFTYTFKEEVSIFTATIIWLILALIRKVNNLISPYLIRLISILSTIKTGTVISVTKFTVFCDTMGPYTFGLDYLWIKVDCKCFYLGWSAVGFLQRRQ